MSQFNSCLFYLVCFFSFTELSLAQVSIVDQIDSEIANANIDLKRSLQEQINASELIYHAIAAFQQTAETRLIAKAEYTTLFNQFRDAPLGTLNSEIYYEVIMRSIITWDEKENQNTHKMFDAFVSHFSSDTLFSSKFFKKRMSSDDPPFRWSQCIRGCPTDYVESFSKVLKLETPKGIEQIETADFKKRRFYMANVRELLYAAKAVGRDDILFEIGKFHKQPKKVAALGLKLDSWLESYAQSSIFWFGDEDAVFVYSRHRKVWMVGPHWFILRKWIDLRVALYSTPTKLFDIEFLRRSYGKTERCRV